MDSVGEWRPSDDASRSWHYLRGGLAASRGCQGNASCIPADAGDGGPLERNGFGAGAPFRSISCANFVLRLFHEGSTE